MALNLPGAARTDQSRTMLGQQLREEIRIQPARILQCVHGRVLRVDPEVQRSVPERQVEVD